MKVAVDAVDDDLEPLLHYQPLASNDTAIKDVLSAGHGASALAVCKRFVVIGTRRGPTYVLDPTGQCIRAFTNQQFGEITAIAIDDAMESVAACANDGSVMIVDILNVDKPVSMLRYPQAIFAVAFRPSHTSLVRSVAVGGTSGELILHNSNWFSDQDSVLHSGEGEISAIAWNGSLIAWTNAIGIKVFDLATKARVAFIPQHCPLASYRTGLSWFASNMLVFSQGDTVHVLQVSNSVGNLLARFQTEFAIGACVPFDNTTMVVSPADSAEVYLVSIHGEIRSRISLPSAPIAVARALNFAPGIEICSIILSDSDIGICRSRNDDDHIAELLDQSRIQDAIEVAMRPTTFLRLHNLGDLAMIHLTTLLDTGQLAEFVRVTPDLLGTNMALWEKWVLYVYSAGILAQTIAVVIPCTHPHLLPPVIYDMVLVQIAKTDSDMLLLLLRKWDASIYHAQTVLDAICDIDDPIRSQTPFQLSLALLYEHVSCPRNALQILVGVKSESVFTLLKSHPGLVADANLIELVALDAMTTVSLLMQAQISPTVVVEQLQDDDYELHLYLSALFDLDRSAGTAFHSLQIPLYAMYQPERLLSFLQDSDSYRLDAAYEVCSDHHLYECQLFLLIRMGDFTAALNLMVEVGDILQAIRFVEQKRSRRLRALLFELLLASNERISTALLHFRSGFIDPIQFLIAIPDDADIDDLKGKLSGLILDIAKELSVQTMSREIMRSDCIQLLAQVQRIRALAIVIDPCLQPTRCADCGRPAFSTGADLIASVSSPIRHADCNRLHSARIQR